LWLNGLFVVAICFYSGPFLGFGWWAMTTLAPMIPNDLDLERIVQPYTNHPKNAIEPTTQQQVLA